MVLLLILNVSLDDLDLGGADAECTVALLPREARTHPVGRTPLELLSSMGERTRRRQYEQQVNVISRSARSDQRQTLASCNATKIGIEGRNTIPFNERRAIFCAENTMNEIACVGMAHACAVPPGLGIVACTSIPTLKRGAN